MTTTVSAADSGFTPRQVEDIKNVLFLGMLEKLGGTFNIAHSTVDRLLMSTRQQVALTFVGDDTYQCRLITVQPEVKGVQ
jgi:hypothetical protein